MILLDEVVQFFIHFERHLYAEKLTEGSSQFAQQISRLRSDAIAIREVVAIGQEAPAAVLARSFVEGVELAMALAIDETFSRDFASAEDQTEFWRRQIGYGKNYPRVEAFLKWAGGAPGDIQERIAHHKAVKASLSGHVHSASHSAMRSVAVPSITHPGMFHFGNLGAISAHFPRLCILVADETHIFSAGCINLIIKPNPPPSLKNTKPTGLFGDVIASAHLIQELLLEYGDEVSRHYERLLEFHETDEAASSSAT